MELSETDLARGVKLDQVSHRLFEYFGEPDWHDPLPAVDELVCTILSQNTNDINRDIAFRALKARYGSWQEVMDADPAELQYVIRVAGLAQQKGPNIQAALTAIHETNRNLTWIGFKELELEEARHWLVNSKVWDRNSSHRDGVCVGYASLPGGTHIYRVSGRIGLRPKS